MRGQQKHPWAPEIDGAGSIRHRSQNFYRRWRGWVVGISQGLGRVAAGGGLQALLPAGQGSTAFVEQIPTVVYVPAILQRQVPAVQVVHVLEGPQIQFIDRLRTFLLCSRGVKTVEIPQMQCLGCNESRQHRKTVEIPQLQYRGWCPLLGQGC